MALRYVGGNCGSVLGTEARLYRRCDLNLVRLMLCFEQNYVAVSASYSGQFTIDQEKIIPMMLIF